MPLSKKNMISKKGAATPSGVSEQSVSKGTLSALRDYHKIVPDALHESKKVVQEYVSRVEEFWQHEDTNKLMTALRKNVSPEDILESVVVDYQNTVLPVLRYEYLIFVKEKSVVKVKPRPHLINTATVQDTLLNESMKIDPQTQLSQHIDPCVLWDSEAKQAFSDVTITQDEFDTLLQALEIRDKEAFEYVDSQRMWTAQGVADVDIYNVQDCYKIHMSVYGDDHDKNINIPISRINVVSSNDIDIVNYSTILNKNIVDTFPQIFDNGRMIIFNNKTAVLDNLRKSRWLEKIGGVSTKVKIQNNNSVSSEKKMSYGWRLQSSVSLNPTMDASDVYIHVDTGDPNFFSCNAALRDKGLVDINNDGRCNIKLSAVNHQQQMVDLSVQNIPVSVLPNNAEGDVWSLIALHSSSSSPVGLKKKDCVQLGISSFKRGGLKLITMPDADGFSDAVIHSDTEVIDFASLSSVYDLFPIPLSSAFDTNNQYIIYMGFPHSIHKQKEVFTLSHEELQALSKIYKNILNDTADECDIATMRNILRINLSSTKKKVKVRVMLQERVLLKLLIRLYSKKILREDIAAGTSLVFTGMMGSVCAIGSMVHELEKAYIKYDQSHKSKTYNKSKLSVQSSIKIVKQESLYGALGMAMRKLDQNCERILNVTQSLQTKIELNYYMYSYKQEMIKDYLKNIPYVEMQQLHDILVKKTDEICDYYRNDISFHLLRKDLSFKLKILFIRLDSIIYKRNICKYRDDDNDITFYEISIIQTMVCLSNILHRYPIYIDCNLYKLYMEKFLNFEIILQELGINIRDAVAEHTEQDVQKIMDAYNLYYKRLTHMTSKVKTEMSDEIKSSMDDLQKLKAQYLTKFPQYAYDIREIFAFYDDGVQLCKSRLDTAHDSTRDWAKYLSDYTVSSSCINHLSSIEKLSTVQLIPRLKKQNELHNKVHHLLEHGLISKNGSNLCVVFTMGGENDPKKPIVCEVSKITPPCLMLMTETRTDISEGRYDLKIVLCEKTGCYRNILTIDLVKLCSILQATKYMGNEGCERIRCVEENLSECIKFSSHFSMVRAKRCYYVKRIESKKPEGSLENKVSSGCNMKNGIAVIIGEQDKYFPIFLKRLPIYIEDIQREASLIQGDTIGDKINYAMRVLWESRKNAAMKNIWDKLDKGVSLFQIQECVKNDQGDVPANLLCPTFIESLKLINALSAMTLYMERSRMFNLSANLKTYLLSQYGISFNCLLEVLTCLRNNRVFISQDDVKECDVNNQCIEEIELLSVGTLTEEDMVCWKALAVELPMHETIEDIVTDTEVDEQKSSKAMLNSMIMEIKEELQGEEELLVELQKIGMYMHESLQCLALHHTIHNDSSGLNVRCDLYNDIIVCINDLRSLTCHLPLEQWVDISKILLYVDREERAKIAINVVSYVIHIHETIEELLARGISKRTVDIIIEHYNIQPVLNLYHALKKNGLLLKNDTIGGNVMLLQNYNEIQEEDLVRLTPEEVAVKKQCNLRNDIGDNQVSYASLSDDVLQMQCKELLAHCLDEGLQNASVEHECKEGALENDSKTSVFVNSIFDCSVKLYNCQQPHNIQDECSKMSIISELCAALFVRAEDMKFMNSLPSNIGVQYDDEVDLQDTLLCKTSDVSFTQSTNNSTRDRQVGDL